MTSSAPTTLPAKVPTSVAPQLPPRFAELRPLGAGGQGGVWVAREAQGELVVLKPIATTVGAGARTVFACLRGLASPNLPVALEVVDDAAGGSWLVTRYVKGHPLTAGPAPLNQVLHEVAGVAHALAALHEAGTHHADIAPANVLVDEEGRVVLTDLGSLGASGFGTPGFVAPEILRGGGGPASDLFSLACLMVWRLTGSTLWPDADGLHRATRLDQVQSRLEQVLGASEVQLPHTLRSLLLRMLHPDAALRPADARALLAVLRSAARWSSSSGEFQPSTNWWPPGRWPFFGPLRERVERLGRQLAREEGPRLVLVHGPEGSGRARVVRELVAVAQQMGASMQAEDAAHFDLDPELAGSGDGQWLEHWLAAGESRGARACFEAPNWAARFVAASPELQDDADALRAAVLLAGARLGRGARVMVVSTALARAVEASDAAEIESLEVSALSVAQLDVALGDVVEGPRRDEWVSVLARESGGWPAQVVRLVRACAEAGAQDPVADLPRGSELHAAGDMSEAEARAVLACHWGAELELPPRWGHAGRLFPWASGRALGVLGETVGEWAREVAANLGDGVEGVGVDLAIALGANERLEALVRRAREEAQPLEEPLLRWVRAHGHELEFELRAGAIEQLLGSGHNEEALALCVAQPVSTPANLSLEVRALQRLGRAAEALGLLEGGAEGDETLLGLRWRAMVDLGRGDEVADQVDRWWATHGPALDLDIAAGRATAVLWGALVRMNAAPSVARSMLDALVEALTGRRDRESASLRARALQLQGNLAHLEGEPERVRRCYAEARRSFDAAGESSAAVWIDGSLCALAVPAGDLGVALEHGRRSLRSLLARGEVQALPGAVWNLVEALVRVESYAEALVAVEAAARVCRVAELGRGGLLLLDASRAQVELQRAARIQDDEAFTAAAAELEELASRLHEAGHLREACASWLHHAATARVSGRPEASKRSRRRAEGGADEAGDDSLQIECALEALDYVRCFKTGPAWGDALDRAVATLAEFDDPPALSRRGELELAFRVDRSLYRAIFRLHGPQHPASRSLRRRAFDSLELMMSKTPTADRPALRSSALADHGDRGALSELLQGLVEDAGEAAPVPASPRKQVDEGGGERRASQLLRMYRRLAREDDLERLLAQVCDVMMELTDGERGVVVVRTGDERHEVLREFSNEKDAPSFSRSIIERVLETGDPVLSVDATEDARFDGSHSISHLNLRSVVAVPLHFRGERLGAAYVDHRLRRGAFGEEDLALMEDFADLAALAVSQTRALNEARQRAARLEKSHEDLEARLDERDAEVLGLRERVRESRDERSAYRGMVGSAPAMQKLYRLIDRLSGSEVPVVIFGESGTGKELVARALHEAGPRADKPFVAENCGAVPESLLESLFFGHARGAFTGANTAKAGLIEAAEGGTIFLDEIGEMSMAMQTKLLRVLQEGEVRRVGETRTRKVDVRVVAASNRDLEAMVECGAFRRDLFYRINVVRLELPALRDRREDILPLVNHFLAAYGRSDLELSARAQRQLLRYPWPGNVRELENEVQRWIALVEDKVRPDDLASAIAGAQGEVDDPDDLALKPRIDRLERELIARALERTGGNQTHAAELLGLSRYGLQKKLKRLNESKATT